MKFIPVYILFVVFIACKQNQSKPVSDQTMAQQKEKNQQVKSKFKPAPGGYYIKSNVSADASAKNLLRVINENENLGLVAYFEHHKMANLKDLVLDKTHTVFFGNPRVGTPLMQKDQLIALDLPQKILTFDQGKDSYLYRLSTSYLADRYDVSFSELSKMTFALDGLCQEIADNQNRDMKSPDVKEHQGVVTLKSNKTFDQAVEAIHSQIENEESIKIMAEVDHQKNAASVDMQLRPTYVIMFGNPKAGIPLIQENRSVAVELPMKFLIYEEANGDVKIVYKDMQFLFNRYNLNSKENDGTEINQMLEKIAESAI